MITKSRATYTVLLALAGGACLLGGCESDGMNDRHDGMRSGDSRMNDSKMNDSRMYRDSSTNRNDTMYRGTTGGYDDSTRPGNSRGGTRY